MRSASLALDPAIEDLRAELRRLFPEPERVTAVHAAAATPVNPYAIVRREYLHARPVDASAAPRPASLWSIRSQPGPLRQAHAACVKVITPYWHGSGVLISPSGDVLTSYHLVAGITTGSVQTLDGRIHPFGEVKAWSAVDDLALIHIDGDAYPVLALRPDQPPPGAALSVVGHPGERSWALTPGRTLRHCEDAGTRVLHFDSEAARGNSGGPVVDEHGRLCAITACAAELADGSKVKVGIAADAIRTFLARPAGPPISLPALAAIESNRQTAEFLEVVYGLTADLIVEWQAAMAALDVEPGPDWPTAGKKPAVAAGLGGQAPAQTVSFANTRGTSEAALRLLLLQTLLARCCTAPGLSPALQRSMRDYVAVLDHLMEAAALLSRRPATPEEARRRLRQASGEREAAEERFGAAVTILQTENRAYGRAAVAPVRFAELERVRLKYAPAGCRLQADPHGG